MLVILSALQMDRWGAANQRATETLVQVGLSRRSEPNSLVELIR